MHGKRQFWLHFVLILSLIISTITWFSPVAANPTALSVLFINETSVSIREYSQYDTFDVYVYITDVIDLYAFDFTVNYDTAVLTANSITLGDFFPADSMIWKNEIDEDAGSLRYLVGMPMGTPEGMTGSGVLAIVSFTVDNLGATILDLCNTKLSESGHDPQLIPHEVFDGFFVSVDVYPPPIAEFTFSPTNPLENEAVIFNASASYDLDGYIVSYDWDFGDGNTGTDVTTTNTYTTYGTYTVTLTVTDNDGLTGTASQEIKVVKPPVAEFTFSPSLPPEGETVTFDASASFDLDGTIVSYSWNFGNGDLGTGVTTTHAYATYGTYTVTLTVTDNDGLTDTESKPVTILAPPVASFTYSPYPPKTNIPITFNASESYDLDGTIVSYIWDFGDGTIVEETDNETTHTYLDIGIYTVKLTTIDDDGLSGTYEKTLPIEIPPPSAQFTYAPMLPVEYEEITFNASKSSPYKGTQIVKYTWDFGDGTIKTYIQNINLTLTPTHKYSTAGSYIVNLTVTDNSDPPVSGYTAKTMVVQRGLIETEADVGIIHFVGEKAEFYFLVKFLGNPVDATEPINAKLYYNGIIVSSFPTKIEHVDTGLYRILWDPIPNDASSGTYTALIQASYFTLNDSTIKSFLISKTLTDWNPLLISIDGTVGTIKTDVGLIKLNLKDINATLTELIKTAKGDILAKIDTALGTITASLDTINAKVVAINEKVATINSTVGLIKTDTSSINTKISAIEGDIVTIQTDVGTIKTTLEEWTGTTSFITTPQGTFKIFALTTSTLVGSIEFSDNVIILTVSGEPGTTGTMHIVIPKQLLIGIESTIDKIATTIDDQSVVFTYTEQPEAYVLSMAYTHSTHTIKIYLAGLPPTLPPWTLYIITITIIVLAVIASLAIYTLKIRKPRGASASKSTATPDATTIHH